MHCFYTAHEFLQKKTISSDDNMKVRNRIPVLTAYIGFGPSVVAGHPKILVEKMGPPVIVPWKRIQDTQRKQLLPRH